METWAVGVTTAPRRSPTLARCLESLRCAGWSDFVVFAEPGAVVESRERVVIRESTLGAWSNWLLAFGELYHQRPEADAYMMVQDDALFCRNVRGFLETTLWPSERLGIVSPYCSRAYGSGRSGFFALVDSTEMIGALSLIFPNPCARLLLSDFGIVSHRVDTRFDGKKNIDGAIGNWCHRLTLPAYAHRPSLIEHIGRVSTLWGDIHNHGYRRGAEFVGEEFNALQLDEANLKVDDR